MPDIAAELARLRRDHLHRSRKVVEGPAGAHVEIDGRRLVNFCSNDYLGLANDPRVAEALARGARRWGCGSGASHLVSGHSTAHHALEEELADFTNRPRALLFSTGYMANLGVIDALCDRTSLILEDRLNHASLLDGARLAQARLRRYPHNDGDALERLLERHRRDFTLVVSDGVFSMDGDLADLPRLSGACRRHGAWLLVDDAHGLGVIGPGGRGTLAHFGLDHDHCPLLVGTLGKAFGTFGAFVAGDEALIDYLIQKARTYIYTTALPPAVAEATRAALHIVREEEWRRERLRRLIARFRQGARALGLELADSTTPIQPLIVGENARALALSEALNRRGFLIGAIRPPTVPAGTARLRITLSAAHEEEDVERLLETLEELTS